MKQVRCAIYTRKSSEEGLEQDFNSLHAQREACAAYVLSQASEGWSLISEVYDDGGVSGGTLERPALQRLLSDIKSGKIDIVVVYKVDRLTRSLLDFSKLVETFDAAGTSFVSVTQSFNTTTSMGRLTLNMLLSFAQFEREVTAERIRDKIAASKAKGMWMGGVPPLGYEPSGRTLAVVEKHAAIVRNIYRHYLDTGNVRLVTEALAREGARSPIRTRRNGTHLGGQAFSRGQIYHMLRNPIYMGKIPHKGRNYEGQHEAIIDCEIWHAVQARLDEHIQGTKRTRSPNSSLLAGKIIDCNGEPLIASHARKGSARYRYYNSLALQTGQGEGIRIPALEIEKGIAASVAKLFDDPIELVARAKLNIAFEHFGALKFECDLIAAQLRAGGAASPLPQFLAGVRVLKDTVEIALSTPAVSHRLNVTQRDDGSATFYITCDAAFRRAGHSLRLVRSNGALASDNAADPTLVKLLVRGRRWWSVLAKGEVSVTTLAAREGVTRSYLTRVVRMAFLAPTIVEALLDGRMPADVDVSTLTSTDAIPALWSAQKRRYDVASRAS